MHIVHRAAPYLQIAQLTTSGVRLVALSLQIANLVQQITSVLEVQTLSNVQQALQVHLLPTLISDTCNASQLLQVTSPLQLPQPRVSVLTANTVSLLALLALPVQKVPTVLVV